MTNPVEFIEVYSIKEEPGDNNVSTIYEILPENTKTEVINENSTSVIVNNDRVVLTTKHLCENTQDNNDDIIKIKDNIPQDRKIIVNCGTQDGEFVIEVNDNNKSTFTHSNLEKQDDGKELEDKIGSELLYPASCSEIVIEEQNNDSKGEESVTAQQTISPQVHNSVQQKYSCSICYTPYSSERGLTAHLSSSHQTKIKYISTKSQPRFTKLGKPYSIKSSQDSSKQIVASKIVVTDPKNSKTKYEYFQCPKCSTRFFSEYSLKLHYSKIHAQFDSRTLIVPMDQNKIKSQQVPVITCGGPKSKDDDSDIIYFHCTQCTTRFLNENSLKRHCSNIHGEVSM